MLASTTVCHQINLVLANEKSVNKNLQLDATSCMR